MNSTKDSQPTPQSLRSFGFILGTCFSLIGLWPVVFGNAGVRLWAIGVGVCFMLVGGIRPLWLAPVYRIWMWIGAWLGWINTRIILGLGFFVIVTPLSYLMRMKGKDPMRRTFDQYASTYRVKRTERPGAHMTHQY